MASRRMTWNVVRGLSGCRPACVRRRHLHEGTEQLAERDASDTRILVRTVVELMLDGPLVPGGVRAPAERFERCRPSAQQQTL